MNPTDRAIDDFLAAHTGGLDVTLKNGKRIHGTVTRAGAHNATNADNLLLIINEIVSRAFGTPFTRRWFVAVEDVTSLTA